MVMNCKATKENQSKSKGKTMSAFGLANKEFSNVLPNVKVDAFIKKHFIEDTNRDTAGKRTLKCI